MGFGDELMVAGRARVLQQTDPRRVRVMYEKGARWNEAWDHNPRIAKLKDCGDFQILMARVNYLRPYMVSKSAKRWVWKAHKPDYGELYFSRLEQEFAEQYPGRVVIEPNLKAGASINKDWGWERWTKLVQLLTARGIQVTQLGHAKSRVLDGVEFIPTPSLRFAAAVIAQAKAAILPEGGLHHVCAAVGTPAIVIFGGYISPEVTGYAGQTNLFVGDDLGCGMRVRCPHCARAMRKITPEHVAQSLK
jgi:ADP-heptose:LPS heptosyltransferase